MVQDYCQQFRASSAPTGGARAHTQHSDSEEKKKQIVSSQARAVFPINGQLIYMAYTRLRYIAI